MRFSRNGYNSDDIAQSEYSQVPEITSIQMETLTVKLSVSFVFLVSTQHSSISCVLWVCRIRVAYGKYKNNVQHERDVKVNTTHNSTRALKKFVLIN